MFAILALLTASNTGCTVCNNLMTAAKSYIKSGQTDQEVITTISNIVKQQSSDFDKEKFLSIFPTVIPLIRDGIQTDAICKMNLFCSEPFNFPEPRLPVETGDEDTLKCDACNAVMEVIESVLDDTSSEQAIAQYVAKYCQKLKSPGAEVCNAVVTKFIPLAMQWLSKGIEKLQVCKRIGFCPADASDPENGITCDVCVSFFHWAESTIEQYSVPALWDLVSNKCPHVPYLKYFCMLINEQNIQTLFDMIFNAVSPQKICTWITICKK